ncbi:cytochrome P450 3A31-like [Patiria miniata]|uniref:Thromboxane-A synthase n=1 Tax=Patiria miniata TaxID=46514 RepID=A0A914BM24_PATMI|nr:cytochrome P450 3A31-like [Patiria miniata]
MIGTITIVLLSALLAYIGWRTYDQLTFFGKLGLKGPTPLPIFGNLFGFKIGVYKALQKWTKEYGKTFGISRGARKVIISSDVDFVREIMVKQFTNFADRQGFPLRPEETNFDLLNLKGDRWKAMRETVALVFTKHKMQKMLPMVTECADETVKNLKENEKKTEGVLDIHKYMCEYGIDVGSYCFFALRATSQEDMTVLMNQANAMWIRFKTFYLPWFVIMLFPQLEPIFKYLGCSIHPHESVDYFTQLIKGTMDSRRADPNSSKYMDFLQLMMNANEELNSSATTINGRQLQKRALTDKEIFAMSMSVFAGNTETSPGTLSFIFFMLAMHPEVQEKLIQEIDDVMGGGDDVTQEKVNKMTYMDMVIRESLRLYPTAASLDRVCSEDCVVKGIKIPKGTLVEIGVYAIQTDPDYWKDPFTFDPERFSAENKAKMDPMTWLAFGQGPRMCIGYRFAMVEMIVMLTRTFQKFRLEICAKTENPPTRGTRGLMTPEKGINLRLVPRQEQSL